MNNTTRMVIFAVFIACAGLMLFGPAIWKVNTGMGELPPQNSLPESDKPMLVEFFSEDCGICMEMKPGIAELRKRYGNDVEFVLVDTNDRANYSISNQFQVEGLPTFYWLTGDRKVLQVQEGFMPIKNVESLLKELIRIHEATGQEVPEESEDASKI